VETLIRNEAAKKDIAAALAVAAALLVTISTSGDFQRKWQAKRVAAAELAITGGSEKAGPRPEASKEGGPPPDP